MCDLNLNIKVCKIYSINKYDVIPLFDYTDINVENCIHLGI